MPRSVLSMFRKGALGDPRRSKPEPLPGVVIAVLDAATIIQRQSAADEAARAVVMLPGSSAFKYSPEGAAKVITATWPELDESQVGQAVKRLGGLVSARLAQARRDDAARQAIHRGDGPDHRPYLHRY